MEMTAMEICRSYNEAARPNKQIKILADLNLCKKSTIVKILNENGIDPKAKRGSAVPGQNKRRIRYKWTQEETEKLMELHRKRYKPADIAKIMGLDSRRVIYKLQSLAKQRKGVNQNV